MTINKDYVKVKKRILEDDRSLTRILNLKITHLLLLHVIESILAFCMKEKVINFLFT